MAVRPSLVLASLVVTASLCLPHGARAEEKKGYYGVCESLSGGEVVIRTTKNSTGHWKLDKATKVTGPVEANDWVYADVETSGHVLTLRSEEHAIARSGVVKAVKGAVLSVFSANELDNWNVTPETAFKDVERGAVKVGDVISLRHYKNHNLAEVAFVKHVD